ncbi:MAG: prenyltransferase [Anaerolineales bacterium]
MATLLDFVRLSRPVFLLGGFLLFALGVGVARAGGYAVRMPTYLLGQIAVTFTQLLTHYLNEIHDLEPDRLNNARTFWTGGSGILPSGRIPVSIATRAAQLCLAISTAAVVILVVTAQMNVTAGIVYGVILLGVWAYSNPPLRLLSTGWGEIEAAIVVAGLTPAFAYALAAGALSGTLFAVVTPLVVIQFAVLIMYDIPDFEADAAGGKHTLVVRLGVRKSGLIGAAALSLAGLLLAGLGWVLGLAPANAATVLAPIPLAVLAGWFLLHAAALRTEQYGWFVFAGVALSAATMVALTAAFWLAG